MTKSNSKFISRSYGLFVRHPVSKTFLTSLKRKTLSENIDIIIQSKFIFKKKEVKLHVNNCLEM